MDALSLCPIIEDLLYMDVRCAEISGDGVVTSDGAISPKM